VESCVVWLRDSSSALGASVTSAALTAPAATRTSPMGRESPASCAGQVVGGYAFALDQSASEFSGARLELFLFFARRDR
jgi:hypothetical protein